MTTEHVHSWQIDQPTGKKSMGRCACGAEREFLNSIEDDGKDWNAMPAKSKQSKEVNEIWKMRLEQAYGWRAMNNFDD